VSQPSTRTTAADLGIGTGVGAFSGAFGVGGGIILVPFLVLVRHVPQKTAAATSLVLVAMAAAAGAVRYALNGDVAWLPAAVILVGGLAGAWVGAHVMQRSPSAVLQLAFAAVLMVAGVRLLWPTADTVDGTASLPDLTLGLAVGYVAAGLGMGLLSALFGIGGGILLIPILVTLFGYGQHLASGTSLAVMVPIALLGAIRLTRPGLTQWGDGVRLGIGAVVGALVGASVALAISGSVLQIAFGILMLVVAVQMGLRGWRGRRPG
jgi:uncharacterized protein